MNAPIRPRPPLTEAEVLSDSIEDALIEYDEEGQLFGSSGAGAYFLAEHLAAWVAALLTAERERIAQAIEGGQQGFAVGWMCNHDFSGAACAWCFRNIDHAREHAARIARGGVA